MNQSIFLLSDSFGFSKKAENSFYSFNSWSFSPSAVHKNLMASSFCSWQHDDILLWTFMHIYLVFYWRRAIRILCETLQWSQLRMVKRIQSRCAHGMVIQPLKSQPATKISGKYSSSLPLTVCCEFLITILVLVCNWCLALSYIWAVHIIIIIIIIINTLFGINAPEGANKTLITSRIAHTST